MFWTFFLTLIAAQIIAVVVIAILVWGVCVVSSVPLWLARPMAEDRKIHWLFAVTTITLVAFGSLYVIGMWLAYCANLTIATTAHPEISNDWLYYVLAFMSAGVPHTWLANKAGQTAKSSKEQMGVHRIQTFCSLFVWIIFPTFCFWPTLMDTPYGWFLNRPEESQADVFENSLYKSILANSISAKLPDMPSEKAGEKQQEMIRHIQDSLQLSKKVSESFLRSLHPDLPKEYRQHLMKGQKLYLQGIQSNNVVKQMRGNTLVMEWQKFYFVHQKTIIR